jgi:S-adenosylmethionine decarboxylase
MRDKEKVLIAVLYGCDEKKINNREFLSSVLNECANILHVNVKNFTDFSYEPYGVTSVKIIAESLLGISTYPEHSSAIVYLSSCSPSSNMRKGLEYLKDNLSAKEYEIYYEGEIPLIKT